MQAPAVTTAGGLVIAVVPSEEVSPAEMDAVRSLCTEAYREDFGAYLTGIGPGVHVLGHLDGQLVSHAMWVTRWLQPDGRGSVGPPLRTAYVEAVATGPRHQRRGLASAVLARVAGEILDFDLGALSPSDERFYARLGWEPWRGPLFVRTPDGLRSTPDEGVMILRLPRTPPGLSLDGPLSIEWRAGEIW